jgi:hypothetical protein
MSTTLASLALIKTKSIVSVGEADSTTALAGTPWVLRRPRGVEWLMWRMSSRVTGS